MKGITPLQILRFVTGFTLLELLIVVVILAVLSGIALPRYMRTVAKSREAEGWMFLTAIRGSELRYYMEHNEVFVKGPPAFGRLDIENPQSLPVAPLFNYCISLSGTDQQFTAIAVPLSACQGCRTLCLDQDGVRNAGAPCGTC